MIKKKNLNRCHTSILGLFLPLLEGPLACLKITQAVYQRVLLLQKEIPLLFQQPKLVQSSLNDENPNLTGVRQTGCCFTPTPLYEGLPYECLGGDLELQTAWGTAASRRTLLHAESFKCRAICQSGNRASLLFNTTKRATPANGRRSNQGKQNTNPTHQYRETPHHTCASASLRLRAQLSSSENCRRRRVASYFARWASIATRAPEMEVAAS